MDLATAFFSFHGRLRRRDFWLYSFFLWLISAAFISVFGGQVEGMNILQPYRFDGPGLIGFVAWLGVLYATLAVQVKRWHDRNKTGWWSLLSFVPIIGWLWVLIECGFLDGRPGDNRFGPSPKS